MQKEISDQQAALSEREYTLQAETARLATLEKELAEQKQVRSPIDLIFSLLKRKIALSCFDQQSSTSTLKSAQLKALVQQGSSTTSASAANSPSLCVVFDLLFSVFFLSIVSTDRIA